MINADDIHQLNIFYLAVNNLIALPIGGLQPIPGDTDNNAILLVDEQKDLILMRDLLFSSTNMAAMT